MKLYCKSKNKGIKTKHKFVIFVFVFIFLIIGIMAFLSVAVNPIIVETSQSKVRSLSQEAVNTAVFEVIKDSSIYDSLIKIQRNEQGDIILISSNAVRINFLSREIIENAQEKLEFLGAKGVNIPVGTFSGMPIFVGRGPNINLKLIPIGAINCTFSSQFVSAGINQTNHRIYLEVSSKIKVILPTANQEVDTKTQMMIAENIIIGKVPQTYLYSNEISDMLNLVP